MNLALGEILESVAPNVGDAGACVATDRDRIVEYINRGQRLLIHRLDSKGTVWPRCIPVCNEVFALPPEFLEVRSVLVNGRPTMQRDQYFEGNGHIGHRGGVENEMLGSWQHFCHGHELFDLGDMWAMPTLLPQIPNAHIALTAQLDEDAGKEVTLQVQNSYSNWITETLTLPVDQGMVYTQTDCYDVRFVVKPITDGDVNLFLVAPNGCYTSEAVYGPRVKTPSYRRKRLPRHRNREFPNCPSVVKIMGKLRFYPALDDTDQLVIGNLDAIIWAVKAVTAQTIGDPATYTEFLQLGVAELLEELRDDESEATISPIEVRTGVRFNSRGRYWR